MRLIEWINGRSWATITMMILVLVGATLLVTQPSDATWARVRAQVLSNRMYHDVYLAVTGTLPAADIVIVEKEREPTPEEVVIAKYIRSQNPRVGDEIAAMMARFICEGSAANNVPVELIVGIIERESMFNPHAATPIPGKAGEFARGLMQVYQSEAIVVDTNKIYNLKVNINAGCLVLNDKLRKNNGALERALSNYSGNTENYARDVLSNVGRFTLYKWDKSASQVEAVASR